MASHLRGLTLDGFCGIFACGTSFAARFCVAFPAALVLVVLSYASLPRGTFLAAFLYEVALVWPPCGCSPLPCGTSFSVSQVYFVVTAFSYPPCGTTLMAFPLWHHRHGTEAQTQNQNPLLPSLPHTSS